MTLTDNPKIQLVVGGYSSGFIQLIYGNWNITVCGDDEQTVSLDTANFVCRHLGFPGGYPVFGNSFLSDDTYDYDMFVMRTLNCPNGAQDLDECQFGEMTHDYYCAGYGVMCYDEKGMDIFKHNLYGTISSKCMNILFVNF